MSKRRSVCLGLVLLAGLALGPLVSTGHVGVPATVPGPARERPEAKAPPPAVTKGEPHPLDPLTPDEMATAVRVLEGEKRLTKRSRFPLLALHEPPKKDVLAWKPGQPVGRRAFAVVLDRAANRTFEAVIDLVAKKTVS